MRLDFDQKNWLISHFSARANWRNVFDARFFLDDTRKGTSRQITPEVTRFTNSVGTYVDFTHKSGTSLSFHKDYGKITILDETGHQLIPNQNMQAAGGDILHAVTRDKAILDVPGTNIAVHFDANGNRTLLMDGQVFVLLAPQQIPDKLLPKGAQVFVADITDDVAQAHGIQGGDLVDTIKMVVARDLGLENDLAALNIPKDVMYTLETHVPGTDIKHLRPFERVRFLEKPWRDTTEFEGHDVALPRTFYVERGDDGFHLITSLDQREAIWSQGAVLQAALTGATPPVRTLNARAQAHHVLQLLFHGQTTRDARNREWNYIIIQTPETFGVADKIRKAMRTEFGLTARHCSVLTFDKGLCVLAMASKVIDAAARHSETARDETHLAKIHAAAKAAGLILS